MIIRHNYLIERDFLGFYFPCFPCFYFRLLHYVGPYPWDPRIKKLDYLQIDEIVHLDHEKRDAVCKVLHAG